MVLLLCSGTPRDRNAFERLHRVTIVALMVSSSFMMSLIRYDVISFCDVIISFYDVIISFYDVFIKV